MRLKGDVKDLQMAKKLLSGIESHFPIQGKKSLLPGEWAISNDFPSAGKLTAKAGATREGPRGRIPPMAGHNEALVLSWVRVGK